MSVKNRLRRENNPKRDPHRALLNICYKCRQPGGKGRAPLRARRITLFEHDERQGCPISTSEKPSAQTGS